MIHSREPWSTRHNRDGSATIHDANGKPIATFLDFRDAERMFEFINGETEELLYLQGQLDIAKGEISGLESELADASCKIEELEEEKKS